MKKCDYLKFKANRIRDYSFCSNWLKFGSNTLQMIPSKVTGFVENFDFSDYMQIFQQRITKSPKKLQYKYFEKMLVNKFQKKKSSEENSWKKF